KDTDAAIAVGNRVDTGTWFMNRCDYLDPALAWTGVKDSGRGCTLSRVGFEHLTRPKSFHLRTQGVGRSRGTSARGGGAPCVKVSRAKDPRLPLARTIPSPVRRATSATP